jgi:hypothetical protein
MEHDPPGPAASQPPSDTLTVTRADSAGGVDELWFAWDNGSTGTMILRWSGDLIAELTVTFSRALPTPVKEWILVPAPRGLRGPW